MIGHEFTSLFLVDLDMLRQHLCLVDVEDSFHRVSTATHETYKYNPGADVPKALALEATRARIRSAAGSDYPFLITPPNTLETQ